MKSAAAISSYFAPLLLLFALSALSAPTAVASSDRCWTKGPEYAVGEQVELFFEVATVGKYFFVITGPDNQNSTNSPLRVSIERAHEALYYGIVAGATRPLGQWRIQLWHAYEDPSRPGDAEYWHVNISEGPAAICYFLVVEQLDRCRVESHLSDNPTYFIGENVTLFLNISVLFL